MDEEEYLMPEEEEEEEEEGGDQGAHEGRRRDYAAECRARAARVVAESADMLRFLLGNGSAR